MKRAAIELRVLGTTELTGSRPGTGDATVRQPKRLALLAYIGLATAEGYCRRDQITALFWPDLDQTQGRTNLRKALHAIREDLGAEAFVTRGEDEIRIDAERFWCDALALARHVRAGEWPEALGLYRGDLLAGLNPEGVAQELDEWVSLERRRLRKLAARAASECSQQASARGDSGTAVAMARRHLELEPDDEEGVRLLMTLLDRRGDRAGALRVYADWQERLQAEFGVEPAPETRKLARKVQAARKGESHETPPLPPEAQDALTEGVAALPAVQNAATHAARSTVAPVEWTEPGATTPGATRSWRRLRMRWMVPVLLGLALVAVLASGATRWLHRPPVRTIAVLPLRSIGDTALQGAADAVTEELTTALASDTALTVRSATRASLVIRPGDDVDVIGRRLGVAYLIDGGVQRRAGQLRITLRLVRAADAVTLWADSYDVADSAATTNLPRIMAGAVMEVRARLEKGLGVRGKGLGRARE